MTVIKADTGPELEPAMPSGCNIRTSAMFIPTLKAITAILMPPAFASTSAAMADGLPIPPLLELITEYTICTSALRGTFSRLTFLSFRSDAPVVATWFGSGKAGCSDGSAQSVLFSDPMALTLHTGGGSKSDIIIFVADDTNKRVCACNVTTGQVSMFAGWRKQIGPPAVHRTALLDVDFFSCRNVCVDPIRNRIFISDERTIRVVETTSTRSGRAPDVGTSSETRIRTLIGGDTGGYEDGIGLNARCHLPAGMVLTADAQTLIFADTNNMVIRSIDLRTEETKTFIGTGQRRNADGAGRAASLQRPRFLAWCKRTATPNEMLYVSCDLAVAKIDMRFRTFRWLPPSTFAFFISSHVCSCGNWP